MRLGRIPPEVPRSSYHLSFLSAGASQITPRLAKGHLLKCGTWIRILEFMRPGILFKAGRALPSGGSQGWKHDPSRSDPYRLRSRSLSCVPQCSFHVPLPQGGWRGHPSHVTGPQTRVVSRRRREAQPGGEHPPRTTRHPPQVAIVVSLCLPLPATLWRPIRSLGGRRRYFKQEQNPTRRPAHAHHLPGGFGAKCTR